MKRVMMFVCAALSGVAFAGNVCNWTGAAHDGKLNTAENWDVAPVSGNGDTLVIDIGEDGTTINNTVADFSVACIKMLGRNYTPLILGGERIVIAPASGSTDKTTVWTNFCSVLVNAPLRLDGNCQFGLGGASSVFNGDISLTGAISWRLVGRPKGASDPGLTGDATIMFNGAVYGPQAALHVQTGRNGNGSIPKFYGKVTVDSFYNGEATCPCSATFYHVGNEIAKYVFSSTTSWCGTDNALTEDTVIQLGKNGNNYVWSSASICFAGGNGKQVANRLSDCVDARGTYPDSQYIGAYVTDDTRSGGTDATLTLKGTDNGLTYVRLNNGVSVVWEPKGDFTQDFRDRAHKTTGTLTVKGGTMRSSGTNVFLNVPTVRVEGGAFDAASTNAVFATTPVFPGMDWLEIGASGRFIVTNDAVHAVSPWRSCARIATGGKFVLAQDVTLDFNVLQLNGTPVTPDTYTKANCTWIEGDGSVVVRSTTVTGCSYWKAAISGNWSDAANWEGGVPGATTKAFITASGADYTVTVDSAITLPAKLEIAPDSGTATVDVSVPLTDPGMTLTVGGNGVLKFEETGSFDSKNKSSKIAVKDGGQLRIDGGTVAITNFTGSFLVSGTESATGRVTVTSGLFRHCTVNMANRLYVLKGGLLEASGGKVVFPYLSAPLPFKQLGGWIVMTGDAKYTHQDYYAYPYPWFATGETVFDGSSTYAIASTGGRFDVKPDNAGETAHVVFKGDARDAGYVDCITIGGTASATGRVDFTGAVWQGRQTWNNFDIAARGIIGCDAGYGELNISAGLVPIGAKGFSVGGNYNSNNIPSGVVHGRVNISGGCLRVMGSESGGWGIMPRALVVGDGMFCKARLSERMFKGEMFISSGSVTNTETCLIIGAGYGVGDFEMTGGDMVLAANGRELMVGFAGGIGNCRMKGGTLTGKSDAYIGGSFTNRIGLGEQFVLYGCPVDRHDAEGTLTVSGGTTTFPGTCYVGANGAGMVEMSGTGGTLSLKNLVTSNTTEWATSSTLKFTLGADGVAPITVSGKTELTDGTKVEVDLTGYTGGKQSFKLIDCANVTANLNALDFTFTGVQTAQARLETRTNGLYACFPRGMMIIVR